MSIGKSELHESYIYNTGFEWANKSANMIQPKDIRRDLRLMNLS